LRILLDTHYLLWWLGDTDDLGTQGRQLISAPENLIFVSVASLWELRIKEQIGKIDLPSSFSEVLRQQAFEILAVNVAHTEALQTLPLHHRDPFDRMLVAQAKVEGLTLLSRDRIIACYEVACLIL